MSLPKQVQQQLEEAERLEALVQGQAPDPAPEEPQDPPPAEPATPAEETTSPAEPAAETPTEAPQDDKWEQRYRSLQGTFRADQERSRAEIAALTRQVETLTAQMADREQPARKSGKTQVTDKDVEDFGPELLDVIRRQAEVVAEERLIEVNAENARLREQLMGVADRQGMSDRQVFFGQLASLVPDYEDVNLDQGFMDWLAEVDPLSGLPRQAYLNDAFERMDAQRTATLFNSYKQAVSPPQIPTPTAPARNGLERHVAPTTARSTTVVPPAAQTKIWTSAEVERFYKDCTSGKYAGRDAERAQTEIEIDAAMVSGRVR